MIIKLLVAIAAVFLANWLVRRWRRAPPAERRNMAWRWGLGAALLILTVAAMTGRAHWLGAAAAGAAAFGRIAFRHGFRFLPFILQRVDRVPLNTPFLQVEVDLKSRRYRGTIISGPHAGRTLESLNKAEFAELAAHYRDRDLRSYYIINLAAKGSGYADSGTTQDGAASAPGLAPSRAEALAILGLNGDPSSEEVIQAHRKLIQKLHPDRGGSDFLAAQVNRAKDVLLEQVS